MILHWTPGPACSSSSKRSAASAQEEARAGGSLKQAAAKLEAGYCCCCKRRCCCCSMRWRAEVMLPTPPRRASRTECKLLLWSATTLYRSKYYLQLALCPGCPLRWRGHHLRSSAQEAGAGGSLKHDVIHSTTANDMKRNELWYSSFQTSCSHPAF